MQWVPSKPRYPANKLSFVTSLKTIISNSTVLDKPNLNYGDITIQDDV